MYSNNFNENYDSEDQYDAEAEYNEIIENETHFDNYFDQIESTYNDLKDYVKYRAKNKNLLKNMINYMSIEPLYDIEEYEYSKIFKTKINKNKDNIIIAEPFNIIDKNNLNSKEEKWIVSNPKNLKKSKTLIKAIERREKRLERKKIRLEKEKIKNMKKRTNDIMKRYDF